MAALANDDDASTRTAESDFEEERRRWLSEIHGAWSVRTPSLLGRNTFVKPHPLPYRGCYVACGPAAGSDPGGGAGCPEGSAGDMVGLVVGLLFGLAVGLLLFMTKLEPLVTRACKRVARRPKAPRKTL